MADERCCDFVREKLAARAAGSRSPICRELEEHLEACPACAACRDRLRESLALCRAKAPLSDGDREGIIRRLMVLADQAEGGGTP
jgi:anti-sigma factor RsiW